MKKSSETKFTQQNKTHKKTDVLDLNKYRSKKAKNAKNSKEKTESEKKQQSAPFSESKVIRMDLYKKRLQAPYTEESINMIEKKEMEEDNSQEKNMQIISLDDYRERKFKRKWKKDIFINTAQVAGMTFLFLFMLMNAAPSFQQGASLKTAAANWFQTPNNKGIVIKSRSLASDGNGANRTPDNAPCSPIGEKDPIKAMNQIDPKNKNCNINKF